MGISPSIGRGMMCGREYGCGRVFGRRRLPHTENAELAEEILSTDYTDWHGWRDGLDRLWGGWDYGVRAGTIFLSGIRGFEGR